VARRIGKGGGGAGTREQGSPGGTGHGDGVKDTWRGRSRHLQLQPFCRCLRHHEADTSGAAHTALCTLSLHTSYPVVALTCDACCCCCCGRSPPGMLIGIAGNVLKQNAIAPPPKDPSMATEEESGRGEWGRRSSLGGGSCWSPAAACALQQQQARSACAPFCPAAHAAAVASCSRCTALLDLLLCCLVWPGCLHPCAATLVATPQAPPGCLHPCNTPWPPFHSPPTAAAGRNFVRGALLGLLATFAGVLIFSAPEYLGQWGKIPLPAALTAPGIIVSSGWEKELPVACASGICGWGCRGCPCMQSARCEFVLRSLPALVVHLHVSNAHIHAVVCLDHLSVIVHLADVHCCCGVAGLTQGGWRCALQLGHDRLLLLAKQTTHHACRIDAARISIVTL
jgi:hypothetical protein